MPITEDFYVFSCLYHGKEIQNDNNTLFCDKPELIISPITSDEKKPSLLDGFFTSDEKKPSRSDFIEQCQRVKHGLPLVWDDSSHNKARIGDKFGFWFYQKKIHIHTIIDVKNPKHRLDSWSENVGQGDRNVITLSNDYIIIPWDDWIVLNGAKRCMGTAHVKKGLSEILNYIDERELD